MRPLHLVYAAVTLIGTTATSYAAGLSFLSDTSLVLLDDTDRKLQLEAALDVLEDEDARSTKEWENSRSGSSGHVQSLGNFKTADGLHCRKLRLSSTAKGVESHFSFPVCKGNDGDWFIASGMKLEQE